MRAELGTWAPVAIMKRIQVLGSLRVCIAWYLEKWWFLTPCLLAATRATAMVRSWGVRNFVVEGTSWC